MRGRGMVTESSIPSIVQQRPALPGVDRFVVKLALMLACENFAKVEIVSTRSVAASRVSNLTSRYKLQFQVRADRRARRIGLS